MAYQNVGTPIFYIDELSWLNSIRLLQLPGLYQGFANYSDKKALSRCIGLNPSTQSTFTHDPSVSNTQLIFNFKDLSLKMDWGNINFWGVLGHDFFNRNDIKYRLVFRTINDNYPEIKYSEEIVNADNTENFITPKYNGFSLIKADGLAYSEGSSMKYVSLDARSLEGANVTGSYTLGSVVYGRYYEMPHSPDLKLTMTREMDGVKRIRTKGGVDLVNHRYIKPPMWGDAGAWEIYDGTPTTPKLSRSGRRTWDLSFSYLQDSDVFGSNQTIGNFSTFWYPTALQFGGTLEDYEDGDTSSSGFAYNLLTDDNFFSQVIHKTNGGQLPFIFQPDKDNNNPDQFAICKFDMNSFKFDQVANGIYNVKLKIREVW